MYPMRRVSRDRQAAASGQNQHHIVSVIHRNETVSLPADIVVEARHMAVDEGMSLSRFVAAAIEQRVRSGRAYRAARGRQLRTLADGFRLGTNGDAGWDRDSLHER